MLQGLLRRAAPAGDALAAYAAPLLERRPAVFALSNLAAMMLALFVSFSLDLPRPVWAMLTVFIVAQPFSGSVRSRAVWRLCGTLIGAGFAVLVTPVLSPSPELFSLVLATWLGACLFLSLLDRSPRGYVPMLAGYTAVIIAFTNVEAPGQIFETALARVEEISVGILSGALAHSVLWPREVSPALNARVARVLDDAHQWLADGLARDGRGDLEAERRRLAADVTDLELMSHHLDFDTARVRPARAAVRALLDRLSALMPLAADLDDRLGLLRASGAADPRFEALARDVQAWLRAGRAGPEAAADLGRRALALEADFHAGRPGWLALVHASAARRLEQVTRTVQESRDLAELLRTHHGGRLPPPVRALVQGGARRPLHSDVGLAALSGIVSAAAMLITCAAWILGNWPDGGSAATFAGIGCCLFATLDDPTPVVKTLGVYIALGVPVAAAYVFLVMPAIDGYVMLGAALAPAILAISYFMARPATYIKALSLSLGFAGGLGLQARYAGDLAAFLNANIALVLGVAVAFAAQRTARVIDAEWNARRMAGRGREEVAALARARAPADRLAWLSHALDRVGLISARAPRAGAPADAARDLRAGLDVIDLQHLRRAAPPRLRRQLDALLAGVARAFSGRRRADDGLLPLIDGALASCSADVGEGEARRIGLAALVGLRRTLFPNGPDYEGGAA